MIFTLTSFKKIESFFIGYFLFLGISHAQPFSYPNVEQSGIYRVDVTANNTTYRAAVFKNSCPKYSLGSQKMEAKDKAPLTLFAGRSINWSKFTLNGSVTIKVTVANTDKVPISGQEIRIFPSRHNVKGTVSGNTVTFTLTEPGQYSIEIGTNGYKNGLILFADPPEIDIPDVNNSNFLVLNNETANDLSSISTTYTGIYFNVN